MVKILFSLLLLCILRQSSYAQDKGIDARAAAIPEVNCVSVDALVSYIKQNFRMLSNSMMNNNNIMTADNTIKYKPENSIVKYQPGDEIKLK